MASAFDPTLGSFVLAKEKIAPGIDDEHVSDVLFSEANVSDQYARHRFPDEEP
jgi:hypothetical protein